MRTIPGYQRTTFFICVLTLLTIAAFLPLRDNGFISIDDNSYLTQNPVVLQGLSWDGVKWAFTSFHQGNWTPLTWISHMAVVELFGMSPQGHHFVNLFIHTLNALILFLVLRAICGVIWPSVAVAAFFAVHPLHVESVAWAVERKDTLSALFALLALWSYVRYVRRPQVVRYIPVVVFLAMGLMAKPMLVTLPVLFLLLDWWPLARFAPLPGNPENGRKPRAAFLLPLAEIIPLLTLSAGVSVLAVHAQSVGGYLKSVTAYPLMIRMSNALISYVSYLRKMAWPSDLAMPYGHPVQSVEHGKAIVAAGFLMVVTVLVLAVVRRAPYLAVGWFWYLGMMVPVVGLVQFADLGMADRFTYLPLIGIFLAVAWGGAALSSWNPVAKTVMGPLFISATVLFAGLSWIQVGYWRNDETLFEHAVRVTRENWLAYENYGATLIEVGKYPAAAAIYEELLRNGQGNSSMYNNLGVLFMYQGRYPEAAEYYRKAITLRPNYGKAYANFGALHIRQRNYSEATLAFNKAIQFGDAAPSTFRQMGTALAHSGRLEEARQAFSQALSLNPGDRESQLQMRMLSTRQGGHLRGSSSPP